MADTSFSIGNIEGQVKALSDHLTTMQKHSFATADMIDISSYTTASNAYECPTDGYVRIVGPGVVRIKNTSGTLNDFISTASGNISSTFLRKGTIITVDGGSPKFFKLS